MSKAYKQFNIFEVVFTSRKGHLVKMSSLYVFSIILDLITIYKNQK